MKSGSQRQIDEYKAHRLRGSGVLSSGAEAGCNESPLSAGGARALNLAAIAATAFRLFRTRSSKSGVTLGAPEIEGGGSGTGCGAIELNSGKSDSSKGPCWVCSGTNGVNWLEGAPGCWYKSSPLFEGSWAGVTVGGVGWGPGWDIARRRRYTSSPVSAFMGGTGRSMMVPIAASRESAVTDDVCWRPLDMARRRW